MGTRIVRASVTIGVVSIGAARTSAVVMQPARRSAYASTTGPHAFGSPSSHAVRAGFTSPWQPWRKHAGRPVARSTDRRNGPTQSVATARLLGPVTVGWMPKFATIVTPSKTTIDADGVSACPRRFIATSAGRGVRTNRAALG